MASVDQIPNDDLLDLDIRRDAKLLADGLADMVGRSERYDSSVLIAAGVLFLAACEQVEIDDPSALLDQLAEVFPEGDMDLDDDPAHGRWVMHQSGRA